LAEPIREAVWVPLEVATFSQAVLEPSAIGRKVTVRVQEDCARTAPLQSFVCEKAIGCRPENVKPVMSIPRGPELVNVMVWGASGTPVVP
jgi:hypothetical protein